MNIEIGWDEGDQCFQVHDGNGPIATCATEEQAKRVADGLFWLEAITLQIAPSPRGDDPGLTRDQIQARCTELRDEACSLRHRLEAAETLLHHVLVDWPIRRLLPEDAIDISEKAFAIQKVFARIQLLEKDAWTSGERNSRGRSDDVFGREAPEVRRARSWKQERE